MDAPHHLVRTTAAACLSAAVLVSCGNHPTAAPTATVASPPSVQAQAQPPGGTPGGPALPDADQRACVGVEAIIAHITVDTARWSPTVHPFDQDIAARLASRSRDLDDQALEAGPDVRRAVAATAAAFGGVAEAIVSKKRDRLDRAVADSRTAYSRLKEACRIRG